MPKKSFSIEQIGLKIARQVDRLLDYSEGERFDDLSNKSDVETALKILGPAKDWYDKTINQQGNLVGVLRGLSDEDRTYLYKLKIGERDLKKGGK